MTSVGIDPRIRHRRVEVARRRGRRRLRVVVAALVAAVLAAGGWTLLHTGLFSARVVTVVGSVHTPASEVVATAGLAGHPPLVDVDAGAVADRLAALPWVRRATVDVQWPDGVRVVVAERRPAALVAAGTGWAEVDRTGRVLADVTSPPAGLPHLSGGSTPGAAGSALPGDRAGLAVAATLPPAFAGQVAQVVQGQAGHVELHLTSPVTVDLGPATQLHAKYEDVAAILAGASLTAGDVVDVAVPGAPIVRLPAGSPPTGAAAPIG
ncbi:MAG: cell division protein FtsQ/DivIB [Acidimicrobiales bacterium]